MDRLFAIGRIESHAYRNSTKGRDVTIIREVAEGTPNAFPKPSRTPFPNVPEQSARTAPHTHCIDKSIPGAADRAAAPEDDDFEKAVRFQAGNGTWQLLGAAEEVGRTNERQAIFDVLRKHQKPMAPQEVADIFGKRSDTVRKMLARMWDNGEIVKTGRGLYTCPECPNVRNTYETDNRTDRTAYESSEEIDPFDPRYWEASE